MMVKKRTGRRPKQAQSTRELILQAAIQVFAKRGISGASLQEIGKACGLSQPAVFYHFKKKEEIVREAFLAAGLRAQILFEKAVQASTSSRDRAICRMEVNLRMMIERPEEGLLTVLAWSQTWQDPKLRELLQSLMKNGRERLAENTHALLREGRLGSESDAENLATVLHGLIAGELFLSFLNLGRRTPAQRQQQVQEAKARWDWLMDRVLTTR